MTAPKDYTEADGLEKTEGNSELHRNLMIGTVLEFSLKNNASEGSKNFRISRPLIWCYPHTHMYSFEKNYWKWNITTHQTLHNRKKQSEYLSVFKRNPTFLYYSCTLIQLFDLITRFIQFHLLRDNSSYFAVQNSEICFVWNERIRCHIITRGLGCHSTLCRSGIKNLIYDE